MNTRQRNRFPFPKFLWAICLVMVMVLCHAPQAYAASPTVEASNYSEFLSAVITAQDGAVISITGVIDIPPAVSFGSPDKHITLQRANAEAFFNLPFAEGNFDTLINHFTFDGGCIESQYQYVEIKNNTTFTNVTFQNCFTSYIGGAAYISNGIVNFKGCIFDGNKALVGGHILVTNNATVNIDDCILRNGQAVGHGGAIVCVFPTTTCNISSSVITENSAGDYAGGVSNNGIMTISNTKIYNNSAVNGGSDIGNRTDGILNLTDSLETLVELFKDDGIVPKGWVCDYDFEAGLFIPDVDPSQPNSLLKLDYEVIPTAVIIDSSSLGTAADGKITGLESGKHYKVTMDDAISYVKSDGILTANESEAEALLGTEIIGLTNGETYKVEEYEPTPAEIPTPTEEPTPEPDPEPDPAPETDPEAIPDPTPTPTPDNDDDEPVHQPSHSGSSQIAATPKAVLTCGKAVLDPTRTDYLLGYTDGLMGQENAVTRAQMAQILYRLLTPDSLAAIKSQTTSFTDVQPGAWYHDAVCTLSSAGIMSGTSDSLFNPDGNVTWGEMITMFKHFVDHKPVSHIITRHWAKGAINTAIDFQWIDYTDQFDPDGAVTRMEMVDFVQAVFTWAKAQ